MNKNITILSKQISDLAKQTQREKKFSGLAIITSNQKTDSNFVILPLRKNRIIDCVAITLHNFRSLYDILNVVDGKVDFVIIDGEQKIKGMEDLVKQVFQKIKKSQILTYKGNDHTADATDSIINEILSPLPSKIISIIGTGNLGSKVALRLAERGNTVYISGRHDLKTKQIVNALNLLKSKNCRGKILKKSLSTITKNCQVLMAFTPSIPVITDKMIEKMSSGGLIIDGGIGTIHPKAIKKAREKGIKVIRLDARAGFSSAVTLAIETKQLTQNQIGERRLLNNIVVSGGWIGKFGDIVVDNIADPKQIVGIADGKGNVIRVNTKFSEKNLIMVNKILNKTVSIQSDD